MGLRFRVGTGRNGKDVMGTTPKIPLEPKTPTSFVYPQYVSGLRVPKRLLS